jgi:hypothetical protein
VGRPTECPGRFLDATAATRWEDEIDGMKFIGHRGELDVFVAFRHVSGTSVQLAVGRVRRVSAGCLFPRASDAPGARLVRRG